MNRHAPGLQLSYLGLEDVDFVEHFLPLFRQAVPRVLNLSKNCLSERACLQLLEHMVAAASGDSNGPEGGAHQHIVDLRSNWLEYHAAFERPASDQAAARGVQFRLVVTARAPTEEELTQAVRCMTTPSIVVMASAPWTSANGFCHVQLKSPWDGFTAGPGSKLARSGPRESQELSGAGAPSGPREGG